MKARERYAEMLRDGKEPRALTDATRAILEEVRAELRHEVGAGREKVKRATQHGEKKIASAIAEGKRQIQAEAESALKRLRSLGLGSNAGLAEAQASAAVETATTPEAGIALEPPISPGQTAPTPATGWSVSEGPEVPGGLVPVQEHAPSTFAVGEEVPGQPTPSTAREPTEADVADAVGANEEEDEDDKAEEEERVAQTAVDQELQPLTIVTTTMSQALVPLSQEADRTPWELMREAWVQRHQATTDERARLAPDLAQHLRRTYDRLAVQHEGWPALADAAALPDEITASAEWFFEMKSPFQNALKERRGEAVTRALTRKLQRHRSKCWACQGGDPRDDVDPACAQHRALSAVDEVRLEMALRAAWAEKALTYAVNAWRQQAAAAERARLASLAREEEDCLERERRYAAEQRAHQMLRPKASKCAACADADFVIGGLCRAHQEELETLCETL